jgi:hypothetical protein
VAHVGEFGVAGDPLGPLLDRPALHLDARAAVPAGQMVMVGARLAPAVEGLAAVVADGVDRAFLAEHLEVAVDGGEPDVLSPPPQLGVDLLGTAEAGEVLQRGRERRRLLGAAHLGAAGRRPGGGFRL